MWINETAGFTLLWCSKSKGHIILSFGWVGGGLLIININNDAIVRQWWFLG